MKTRINAAMVVLGLLAYFSGLCSANAFYDPGTQRWLNRDPIDESAFRVLKTGSQPSPFTTKLFVIIRNSIELNGYAFVQNDSVRKFDAFGLDSDCQDCTKALPLKNNNPVCDAYGNGNYLGAKLSCFCKCAGNSDWSQKVRGCLACEFKKGTPTDEAHHKCYEANGGMSSAPVLKLLWCQQVCADPPASVPDGR